MSNQKHAPEDELKTLLATLWKNTIAPHKASKDKTEESIGVLDTIVSVSAAVQKKPPAKSASESQVTLMSVSVKPKPPSASGSHVATIFDPTSSKPPGTGTQRAGASTRAASSTKRGQSTFVAAEKLASISASRLSVIQKLVVDSTETPKEGEEIPEFEIVRVLGQGGMGVVYEARQAALDRTIALKMIKSTLAQDQDTQAVFLAEAAVTGELDHPGVVPIYDLGVQADGALFYAMKQVKGVPWNKVLSKKTVLENIEVLMKVADAVAFGHSKGIIHRDLKPENIMLGEFGEVLVMDWGLAASVIENGKIGRLNTANAAGGTPAYMAPEMATGNVDLIGYQSDVYLLGAILYEIVTGLRPHTGKDMMAVLYNIATNVIQVTDKKGELVDIALKAMATKPGDRYATVKDLQAAVKDSQKHFESIALADKAAERLEKANKSKVYEDYAQALFGFQQALEMWDANRAAQKGAQDTRFAYTKRAIEKDDIDLAASLIEPVKKQYPQVVAEIERMRQDREARRKRLQFLTYGSAGLAATILIGVTVAYFLVSAEKENAIRSEKLAQQEKIKAEDSRQEAVASQKRAEENEAQAVSAQRSAELARRQAEESQKEAEAQKVIAEANAVKLAEEKARVEKAVKDMLEAQDATKAAEMKKALAEQLKVKAESELEKTGMLLATADKWVFDPAKAVELQKAAGEELGKGAQFNVTLPNGQTLALVAIPKGLFVMGSPARETARMAEEYLHTVTLSQPYYMAKTELTVAQWKAITGSEPPVGSGPAPEPQFPVANINTREVDQLLLTKLNRLAPEGYEFRLPTEAEWEWACRAGSNSAYASLEKAGELPKSAWFRFNSEGSVHPVGTLAANAFGLHDMHGNVSELCQDYYDPTFYLGENKDRDPVNSLESKFRVVRGGGWVNMPQHARSAYRSYVHVENRYDFLGIRLVMVKKVAAVNK